MNELASVYDQITGFLATVASPPLLTGETFLINTAILVFILYHIIKQTRLITNVIDRLEIVEDTLNGKNKKRRAKTECKNG